MSGVTVAVVIPALDEEEALPGVLAALPPECVDRVMVVDNGSCDRTAEVARANGAAVIVEDERGYGAACLAALEALARSPAPPDVVAFVDADARTEAEHLAEILDPIVEDRADLVLGVRAGRSGTRGNLHTHARVGNRAILLLTRLLFGVRFSDLPPFRAIRFRRLQELSMDDRNWGWTLQMQIRAARRGLRMEEILVPHRDRVEGRSKISGSLGMSIRVGIKMVYTIVRERLRPRPHA